jgi:hypothetical protein
VIPAWGKPDLISGVSRARYHEVSAQDTGKREARLDTGVRVAGVDTEGKPGWTPGWGVAGLDIGG